MRWWWIMLVLPTICLGEHSVTLAWDANPETDIVGYIVYYGSASRNYTNAVNVGNVTTNMVIGLVDGVTYFFAVTAYNTNGLESDFSDEVSCCGVGSAPSKVTGLAVQYKESHQVALSIIDDCVVPRRRRRKERSLTA